MADLSFDKEVLKAIEAGQRNETSIAARNRRGRLQHRYKPTSVRFLFVGEAPPVSGRFFYRRDSGLYRAIRESFQALDPSIDDTNFLETFRDAGCYLIDLCPNPVDHLDTPSRRAACIASERSLSRKIKQLRPKKIVTMLRSIEDNVSRAVAHGGWRGQIVTLPYPGRWAQHRTLFVSALAAELQLP